MSKKIKNLFEKIFANKEYVGDRSKHRIYTGRYEDLCE